VAGLVVDELGVLLERREPGDADRLLELGDRVGVPHVVLAVAAPLVLPAVGQHLAVHLDRREADPVPLEALAGDDLQRHALDPAGRAGEVLVDQLLAEADASKIWAPR
jgi:hypothetical protein